MKAKVITGKILMAFVLITIGFAGGKEFAFRTMAGNDANQDGITVNGGETEQDKVIVYYMHTTFRCTTCNSMESMAKEVVENNFADGLSSGLVEWQAVNFQENTALGRRYGVGASTIVVVKVEDGKEVDFKRLDEVWTKVNNPAAFKSYVEEAIQEFLGGLA